MSEIRLNVKCLQNPSLSDLKNQTFFSLKISIFENSIYLRKNAFDAVKYWCKNAFRDTNRDLKIIRGGKTIVSGYIFSVF